MCCKSDFLKVKNFFWCWSLRIGTLIIGYLGLIGHVLQTTGGSAHLAYVHTLVARRNENLANENCTAFAEYYMANYTQYMAIALTYHAILVFFHIALVWGVHKNKSEYILPWLIVKGLEWILVVIAVIVVMISLCVNPGYDVGIVALIFAIIAVCIWLMTYMYMCVFSFYHEVKNKPNTDEEEPPTYIRAFHDGTKNNEKALEAGLPQNAF